MSQDLTVNDYSCAFAHCTGQMQHRCQVCMVNAASTRAVRCISVCNISTSVDLQIHQKINEGEKLDQREWATIPEEQILQLTYLI